MRNLILLAVLALSVALFSKSSFSYGPHDENCVECHSIHNANGEKLPAVKLSTEKNPITGETVKGVDGFCLGCHNKALGILPVELHKTHPIGIAPKRAKVPADNLTHGLLGCMSCHNPHPSNPNYKYLVADTNGGKEVGKFCSYCHPGQYAPKASGAAAPKKK